MRNSTVGVFFMALLGALLLNQVVGFSLTAAGQSQAFLWTLSHGMSALPTLGGQSSKAIAINAVGVAAGQSLLPGDSQHAVVWTTRLAGGSPRRAGPGA